jgi:hypothetical protein
MTTTLEIRSPRDITRDGQEALRKLKELITMRPEKEKLVIKGKQYLYYYDWQTLGAFTGIYPSIIKTEKIEKQVPLNGHPEILVYEFQGYKAYAVACRNGQQISAAEAICLKEEANWQNKDQSSILSMAETRACRKALSNCLQWIIKLPTKDQGPVLAEEPAEEIEQPKMV